MEHVSSVHPTGKFPEKVENLKRWACFPGWNFRTECRVPFTFLVLCTSSRSTVGQQLFTNRKFHFCSHWNFRVFFLNGKRPLVILLGLLIRQVRLKLSSKSMSNLPSLLFVSIRLRLRSPMRITVCFWSSAHMHNDVILSWVHLQACNFFELWKQKAVVGKEVYFWRVKDVNNSHLSPNKLLLGTTYFAPQKYTLLQ